MCNIIVEFHKHNKQNRPDTKEYMLYDSIFVNFKNRQN